MVQEEITNYFNGSSTKRGENCLLITERFKEANLELKRTELAVVSKYAILTLAVFHLLKEMFQAAQVKCFQEFFCDRFVVKAQ